MLKVACFSTVKDGKDETFSPVIVWIAVHPNTINIRAICDISKKEPGYSCLIMPY